MVIIINMKMYLGNIMIQGQTLQLRLFCVKITCNTCRKRCIFRTIKYVKLGVGDVL